MPENNPTPAAAPAVTPPTTPAPAAAPVVNPTLPTVAPRQTVSAKKALGTEGGLKKAMNAEVDKIKNNLPKTTVPYTPPAPKTPEEDDAPVVVKPAEPAPAAAPVAEPPKPAATPAAAAPAAPAKVTIDGKEYSVEELQAALAASKAPAPAAPAAAPATPAAAAAAPPAPTKEQIAEAESAWKQTFIKESGVNFAPTAAEMETLLSGGEDAVALFASKQTDLFAHAVMAARKSIFEDINKTLIPELDNIRQGLQPLHQNHQQLQEYGIQQEFIATHPTLAPQVDLARSVAQQLLSQYPEQVSKFTRPQFIAEVARQTNLVLDAQAKVAGFSSWKEQQEAVELWKAKNAAPAAAPAATPAAAAPAPAPAAPAPAKPLPPAANAPAAAPAGAAVSFAKSVAASLQG